MNFLNQILCLSCVLLLIPGMANGAFVHGSYVGDTVDVVMVTETNDHEPDLFWDISGMLGDTLLVNPVDFRVDVGSGPGTDFLDSQLEMMIQSKQDGYLTGIQYAEYGDYFITGNSSVSASVNWFLDVPGVGTAGGTLQVTDSSAGPSNQTATWSIELDIDLVAGTANNQPLMDVVTGEPLVLPSEIPKVTFEFDNTLFAGADDVTSTAFIAKKGTTGVGVQTVPEPSSLLLGFCGLGLLASSLRRIRSAQE